jgi:hypothetical protein
MSESKPVPPIEAQAKAVTCPVCGDLFERPVYQLRSRRRCLPCERARARELFAKRSPEQKALQHLRQRRFRKGRARLIRSRSLANRPKAHKAGEILRHAIGNGKIIKPKNCSVCGTTALLHGHHEDYEKPLEVIWVCHPCHIEIHRKKK